mmetsp:Transcript_64085/g.150812  ORF Transcript_64085/g.150812 Transcript_64085/m.150812 type:complete len:213 (+) Transcript_64085:335-973(+)
MWQARATCLSVSLRTTQPPGGSPSSSKKDLPWRAQPLPSPLAMTAHRTASLNETVPMRGVADSAHLFPISTREHATSKSSPLSPGPRLGFSSNVLMKAMLPSSGGRSVGIDDNFISGVRSKTSCSLGSGLQVAKSSESDGKLHLLGTPSRISRLQRNLLKASCAGLLVNSSSRNVWVRLESSLAFRVCSLLSTSARPKAADNTHVVRDPPSW